MPGKAAIQAAFGRRRVWTRKGPFSCPSVAMSVRTRPMFAIPFAVNLGSVAVISRRCGILGCNERAHGPPMFAIPTPDVCRSLQVATPFGHVTVRLPRFCCAKCGGIEAGNGWPSHCRSTPELDQLQARLCALMPYREAADVLAQMLPLDAGKGCETLRRHTLKVGEGTVSKLGVLRPRSPVAGVDR